MNPQTVGPLQRPITRKRPSIPAPLVSRCGINHTSANGCNDPSRELSVQAESSLKVRPKREKGATIAAQNLSRGQDVSNPPSF